MRVVKALQRHQSSLYYIFICIISFYVLSLNIVFAITNNPNNDTSITPSIPKPEPYSSFFIQILENPFSSTILSALAIAVITYTVSKVRSIQSSLGDIKTVKDQQPTMIKKMDEVMTKMGELDKKMIEKMDERDMKYDGKIEVITKKMDEIKTDLDSKIWAMVMSKDNKK